MFNHRHLQHFISARLVGIYDHPILDQLKYETSFQCSFRTHCIALCNVMRSLLGTRGYLSFLTAKT